MAEANRPPVIQPNPGAARVVGALSVLFGVLLFLLTCVMAFINFQPEPFERLETNPKKWGFQDPLLDGFMAIDIASGLVLNLVLIVAGIGLLRLRRWGRKLGIWVAALKIARLAVIGPISILFLATPMAKQSAESDVAMQKAAGEKVDRRDVVETTKVLAVIFFVYDMGMLIFGPIYPAIMLWVLTRPGVKAACEGKPRPPPELV